MGEGEPMLFELEMGSREYWILMRLTAVVVATWNALLWARRQERLGVPPRRLWRVVLATAAVAFMMDPAMVLLAG